MAGMLYLVPTPIGNLGDISIRCREILEQADFIAAEDTRVSLKLLNHLGIKKSLVSYYEHNKAFKGDKIVERILAGEKTITARRAFEIIQMNRNGQKPESLIENEKDTAPVSMDLLDQENINRFDNKNKRKKSGSNKKRNNNRRNNGKQQ